MKSAKIIIIALAASLSAAAQNSKKDYTPDSELGRWVIDLNLLGGANFQNFMVENSSNNYLNAVNTNTGKLAFKNGMAYGGDAQLGFFFGKKRHWGVGTGIMYLMQDGDAILDNYHVEYQATDGAGNIYRQVVTGNIKEEITSSVINVPVVLK